ncbi:MAG: hypothetical protein M3O28_05710 [Actinomycetota bacterium]|nr:hypothetical protein [Actinomycetota bacterium]
MSPWRERFKAHGEVPRSDLEPYRGAGGAVYEYVLELDAMRAGDTSLPGVQAALLAGWNAFALQLLGDEMIAASSALDPRSTEYVPQVTAEQAMRFYLPVQEWMGRAAAAKANPSYLIDVPLPEPLPEWVEADPYPASHLLALRQAVARLKEHTEGLVPGFTPPLEHAREIVNEGIAEAGSASDYATRMWGTSSTELPPGPTHGPIAAHLQHAAESYFYIGQVIAMPRLADEPRRVREKAPEAGGPRSFLETMAHAYPQVAQRPRGGSGALAGIAGGLLGGLIGGEILGGLGGFGDGDGGGDWGGGGGDWGGGGDGGFF